MLHVSATVRSHPQEAKIFKHPKAIVHIRNEYSAMVHRTHVECVYCGAHMECSYVGVYCGAHVECSYVGVNCGAHEEYTYVRV